MRGYNERDAPALCWRHSGRSSAIKTTVASRDRVADRGRTEHSSTVGELVVRPLRDIRILYS